MRKKTIETIEELVLDKLAGMNNVVLGKEIDGVIDIEKEGVKFGQIKGETIFLRDQAGKYKEISEKIVENTDNLLSRSTKAFWFSKSKADTTK